MDEIAIIEAGWTEREDDCVRIRREVFVDEQLVPEEIEIDGEDAQCRHFLAIANGVAVATGRLKAIEGGVKIQRVAVLKQARGGGVGLRLMRAMIDASPAGDIMLDAQLQAIPFYEKLGFRAEGEVFLDAGIPHRRMRMNEPRSTEGMSA